MERGVSASTLRFSFAFLDETGSLGSPRDPFFAVGLLQCPEPAALLRPLQRMRDKTHFYDEIKWSGVSTKKLPVLTQAVDCLFGSDACFSAFVTDKAKHDVISRFGGLFQAYEALSRQLILASARKGEMLWVIADEFSTPPTETFEENVRDWVNSRAAHGQAVAGVCRMRSSGSDLLQLADLLLGAVAYEHKATLGLVDLGRSTPKVRLLDHIHSAAGVTTFVGGVRNARVNVASYGDG